MSTFDFGSVLLLLAAAIGLVNERTLRLPRPVALLLGGLAVAALIAGVGLVGHAELGTHVRARIERAHLPEILLDGFLALLLFAGSLRVDARDLRRRAFAVSALATVSVALAAVLFAVGLWAALWLMQEPVPFGWCFVAGAILAPTDPVAVEGLLAGVRLPSELRAIIAGESLFNDGAAVVLFGAALALVGGQTGVVGHGRLLEAILAQIAGGAALGSAAGYCAWRVARSTRDAFLGLMISLALALSAYRAALDLGVSGAVAVVSAGLAFSYALGAERDEAPWRGSLLTFWSLIDDLLNALLYLFVGFEVLMIEPSWRAGAAILVAAPLALLARLASVSAPMLLPWARAQRPARAIGILTWAGLRGGVSIALALLLPASPYRPLLVAVCFGVVVFTVVAQGLLLRRVVAALYEPLRLDATAD